MKIPYFVIDAFTGDGLKGNPAGVCVLPSSLKPQLMQEIAARNNLPETAFICRQATGWSIRWFTPTFEIDLCGHATLAAAFAVLNFYELQAEMVKFMAGCGCLTVRRCGNGYELALPAKMPQEIAVTDEMRKALGLQPLKAWQERRRPGNRLGTLLFGAAVGKGFRQNQAAGGAAFAPRRRSFLQS